MFGLMNRKRTIAPRIEKALSATYTSEEMAAIDRFGTLIQMDPSSSLIIEGAIGNEALLIIEGSADVSRGDTVIAQVGAGDMVGEAAILTGERRNATLIATTEVAVIVFNAREFRSLLEQVPSLGETARELVVSRG